MTEPTDDTRRIGQWMMLGAWICVFVIATVLLNRYFERSRNPNNEIVSSVQGGKRSLVLQRNRQGHYLVSGAIDGEPAVFLIDTGATGVSIPEDLARKAGLERGATIRISTANGVRDAYATRVNSLVFGDVEIRNVPAHINPGLFDEVLLGMSVLRHFELVQRGEQLIIREP